MSKDDATWLKISYVIFGLIVAYIAFRAFETLGVHLGWVDKFDWFATATQILGLVVGVGGAVWCGSSPERYEYHLGTVSEVRKVIWPSFPDVKKMTIIVAIVVAIFSVIL